MEKEKIKSFMNKIEEDDFATAKSELSAILTDKVDERINSFEDDGDK